MTEFDELVQASFQIIAVVGTARSCYIEAIGAAKRGEYEEAFRLIDQGEEAFGKGHELHTGLLKCEASGDPVAMTLMLTHAEDQLMSAESFGILAHEFIDVYRAIGVGMA